MLPLAHDFATMARIHWHAMGARSEDNVADIDIRNY